ncbi:hypothetical protein Tco_0183335 [Tanacetum coccineum]
MVGASHAAYTDRFHELAGLVPHLVTPENRRIKRNGSLKRNPERKGNVGEPSRDRNRKDDVTPPNGAWTEYVSEGVTS